MSANVKKTNGEFVSVEYDDILETGRFISSITERVEAAMGTPVRGTLYFSTNRECKVNRPKTFVLNSGNKQQFVAMDMADQQIYIFDA